MQHFFQQNMHKYSLKLTPMGFALLYPTYNILVDTAVVVNYFNAERIKIVNVVHTVTQQVRGIPHLNVGFLNAHVPDGGR